MDELEIENRAGEPLGVADPREVLAVLAPLAAREGARLGLLRADAWLRIARRDGPSAEAEREIRRTFEVGLQQPGEGEVLLLHVVQPLDMLEEYLAIAGRLDDAALARDQATASAVPASAIAGPREWLYDLAYRRLRAEAHGNVLDRALEPDFLPTHWGFVPPPEARATRVTGALPDGTPLELVMIGFTAPVRPVEPLWIAYARRPSDGSVRFFSCEWSREGREAAPVEWGAPNEAVQRVRGHGIQAGGAPPLPWLGTASPYFLPFVTWIGQSLLGAKSVAPQSLPGPSAAPRPRSKAGLWLALGTVLAAGLVGAWLWKKDADATQLRDRVYRIHYALSTTPAVTESGPLTCTETMPSLDYRFHGASLLVGDPTDARRSALSTSPGTKRPLLVAEGTMLTYAPSKSGARFDVAVRVHRIDDLESGASRVICRGVATVTSDTAPSGTNWHDEATSLDLGLAAAVCRALGAQQCGSY